MLPLPRSRNRFLTPPVVLIPDFSLNGVNRNCRRDDVKLLLVLFPIIIIIAVFFIVIMLLILLLLVVVVTAVVVAVAVALRLVADRKMRVRVMRLLNNSDISVLSLSQCMYVCE